MRVTRFTCDICGLEKTETSPNWVMCRDNENGLTFRKWDSKLEGDPSIAHLCSPDCWLKKLAGWVNPPQITRRINYAGKGKLTDEDIEI